MFKVFWITTFTIIVVIIVKIVFIRFIPLFIVLSVKNIFQTLPKLFYTNRSKPSLLLLQTTMLSCVAIFIHLQLRQTDEQFNDFFVASPGLALAGWTYDLAFDDVTEVGNFFAHTHEVTTNWPLYAMLVQMYGALGWNELLLLRSKVFLTDDDDEEDGEDGGEGEDGDGDVDGGDGGGEVVVTVEEDITVEEVVNDDDDKEEEIEVREGETKTKKEQDSVPTDLVGDSSTISSTIDSTIDSTTVQETETEQKKETFKQKKIKTTNPETKPTTPTTPTTPTATTPPIQIPRRSLQPALESLFQTLYLDILSLNEWTEEQIEIDRQDAKDAEELR